MMKNVQDLKPGDRYESFGFVVEVVGEPIRTDSGIKVWCRIDDSPAEGWITFAPDAQIRLQDE